MISSQARGGNHPPAVLALALPAISTLDFFVMCTFHFIFCIFFFLLFFLALIQPAISIRGDFYLYILSLCIFSFYLIKHTLPPLLNEKLNKLNYNCNFQVCSCCICCCDSFNCLSVSLVLYCCLNDLKVVQYLCCHCLIFGNK